MFKLNFGQIEYRITNGRNACLDSAKNYDGEILNIPEMIDGKYRVTEISKNAFYGCTSLRELTIPKTVERIGELAFAWCKKLEKAEINGANIISSRAFMGCDKLKFIQLTKNISEIGDKAFAYCPSIEDISLPDNLNFIGESVFEGCRNLRSVVLPDNLKIIKSGCFYACTSLKYAVLPKQLEYIDEFAFAYCASLEFLSVPKSTVINESSFFECKKIMNVGKAS